METNLKKLLPMLGIACLCASSLFAGNDSSSGMSGNGMSGTKTAVPPGNHPGEYGPDVFVSADYTLWTARQAGLSVATANYYSPSTTTSSQGSVYYPQWKLRSGFKVGLGAYLAHDMWDIQAEYTWFYNKNNKMHNAGFTAGQGLSTWWISPSGGADTLDAASSKWNNWFNRIDLQLARNYFAGHYLSLRPFLGLLGAWDCQWLDIDYIVTDAPTVTQSWANKQTFWGVGPYTGVDAAFCFPVMDQSNQWSLFLDSGISLPWSKFQARSQRTNTSTEATGQNLENTFWTVAPMIEIALGLRWETWWSDNKWMFLLQAAWEEQVWFAHNNFIMMGGQGTSAPGDYIMQGLTIKAKLAF